MTSLMIGSYALALRVEGTRPHNDVDYFSDHTSWNSVGNADAFWHPYLAHWLEPDTCRVATLDELYTIKLSHSYWDLRNGTWDKHMADMAAMRAAGAVVIQWIHDLLYLIWTERYGPKRVSLSGDRETFFGPGIRRYYVHDSVHMAVAFGSRPLYERILRPDSDVAVDPARLASLTDADRMLLWREETAVLALERYVIPSGTPPKAAWLKALRLMITSTTKGASAQWLAEHYDTLRKPDDYIDRFRANRSRLVPMGES